jgi:predicted O-linked N-acetylglucosamine transferase (SPINDLY family)
METFERAKELFLQGVAYFEERRFDLAEAKFHESLTLVPDRISTLTNLAATLIERRDLEAARELCLKVISIDANAADAWHYLGVIDCEQSNDAGAVEKFDRALAVDQDQPAVHNNRGMTLRKLGRLKEALASYDRALELKPDFAEAYYNRGQVLREMGRLEETCACYEQALKLRPDYEYLYGSWLHARMMLCDWSGLDNHIKELGTRIEMGEKVTPPFPVLALSPSLSLQRKAAEIWVKSACPENGALGPTPRRSKSGEIRIGYYSADFRTHVVSSLTAGVFELHDRDRFEIFALSHGEDTKDPMRLRLESAFDEFIDVQNKPDAEVARLSRDLGIDIAVDLGGHTKDSRTGIFALRAAPIQVNYIGYPGTMGASYIDYIIADRHVVPEGSASGYTEKIAYLPCFQANDDKREVSRKVFSRRELGLPDSGFVFCCFNSNYKITPEVFDIWARILRNVEGSVLFLYADNTSAERNLREAASARRIEAGRIVFGKRLAIPEYLARYRTADMFLDTYPFNGGATVSDALWSGLPVLTWSGQAFASRMAASLLSNLDTTELIAKTREEYVALAVALAREPARLKEVRAKLVHNRLTKHVFNTAAFTRQLEAAYMEMYQRYRAGLPLGHIYVPS